MNLSVRVADCFNTVIKGPTESSDCCRIAETSLLDITRWMALRTHGPGTPSPRSLGDLNQITKVT